MRYIILVIGLLVITGCTREAPTLPPISLSGTTAVVDTGTVVPQVPTTEEKLTEGEIISLVESELIRMEVKGDLRVDLSGTTELENLTTDGKSYTIYEGELVTACSPDDPTCAGPRFFLVTEGKTLLYFEYTTGVYSCPDIEKKLRGEILEIASELFCL